MNQRIVVWTSLFAAGALLLSGCGGGGGSGSGSSSTTAPTASISGVASKGPLSKARVTAWCGDDSVPTNKLGETTTADGTSGTKRGAYSITYDPSRCNKPIKLIVERATGAKMLNELTGNEIDVPENFVLKAFVADPATTSTKHITPFSDLSVKLVEREGIASKAKVENAENAVTRVVLANDPLTLHAEPKPMSQLVNATESEKKLLVLLTAVAQYAESLSGTTQCGADDRLVCALRELGARIQTTVTGVTDTSFSIDPGLVTSPVADQLKLALQSVSIGGAYDVNVVAEFLNEKSEAETVLDDSSSSTATIASNGGSMSTTTMSAIDTAKQLFASLRTDVVALSNSTKTAFLDEKFAAVQTQLDDPTKMANQLNIVDSIETLSAAITTLVDQAVPALNQTAWNYTGIYCTHDSTTQATCNRRTSTGWSWDPVTFTSTMQNHIVQYVVTKDPANNRFLWVARTGTHVCLGSDPTPCSSTSPVLDSTTYLGTVTNPYDAAQNPIAFTVNGTLPPEIGEWWADQSQIDAISTFKREVMLTITHSGLGDATLNAGDKQLALTGTVLLKNAQESVTGSLTLTAGTEILGNRTAANGPGSISKVALVGSMDVGTFRYNGSFTFDQFAPDVSNTESLPRHAKFIGRISTLANNVPTLFLDGTFDWTITDDGGYNATDPATQNSWKGIYSFLGQVIKDGTTYQLSLTLEDVTLSSGTIDGRYTKNSVDYVSITGTYDDTLPVAADSTATFSLLTNSGSSGITVTLTQNLVATNAVMTGVVKHNDTTIGTITNNRVNFTDGTFIVIL